MAPTSFIGDPTRLRLWLGLHQRASAIAAVRRWRVRDGGDAVSLRGHQHVVPTLVLCLEGVVRVVGAATLDLAAGEALVVSPGCWHEHVRLRPGSVVFGLGFIAQRCDILLADHQESSWGAIPEQPFRLWMDQLLALDERQAAESRRLIEQMLQQIFSEKASPIEWLHPAVQRMASALWWRLHTPIAAADIVRAAAVGEDGIGHSRAYELFTAFFGATPKQELLSQRLALASQLLREGESVADAASRCGFASRASFTRAWRRRHGQPPSSQALAAPAAPAAGRGRRR
jgi:AraC-like DNA-binding protein